ncbi:MAG: transposase, partial [Anaerolineae bacterium]
LSRYREQLVKEQTANLNRLHRHLANQYPTYKTFFSELNGVTALHFWTTYPTPAHLRATTPQELADFFREKSKHSLGRQAARHKARQIFNVLDDVPISEPGLLVEAQGALIRDLAKRLLQLKRSIEDIEAKLEETVPSTGQQLETFQGIGTVSAAVLIGETRDTARFNHDKDRFAKYNGSAPVTKGTGKHARQVENHWCNRRLKSTLGQVALAARHNEPLSAEYYQACLDRGLNPGEAHKRLMRRLSDIFFAMMRDKTPYDPEIWGSPEKMDSRLREIQTVV